MTPDLHQEYSDNEDRIYDLCEQQQRSDRYWGLKIHTSGWFGVITAISTVGFASVSWVSAIPCAMGTALFFHICLDSRSRYASSRKFRDEVLERALAYRKSLEDQMKGG